MSVFCWLYLHLFKAFFFSCQIFGEFCFTHLFQVLFILCRCHLFSIPHASFIIIVKAISINTFLQLIQRFTSFIRALIFKMSKEWFLNCIIPAVPASWHWLRKFSFNNCSLKVITHVKHALVGMKYCTTFGRVRIHCCQGIKRKLKIIVFTDNEAYESACNRIHRCWTIGTQTITIVKICHICKPYFIGSVKPESPHDEVGFLVSRYEFFHCFSIPAGTSYCCSDSVFIHKPAYLVHAKRLSGNPWHKHIYLAYTFLKAFVCKYLANYCYIFLISATPVNFACSICFIM